MMNETIWKFELKTVDEQWVEMPVKSTILALQTQNNIPCLWALVNPNEDRKEKRLIKTFGTGHSMSHDVDVNTTYLGTYQLNNGSLVFHVFECTN